MMLIAIATIIKPCCIPSIAIVTAMISDHMISPVLVQNSCTPVISALCRAWVIEDMNPDIRGLIVAKSTPIMSMIPNSMLKVSVMANIHRHIPTSMRAVHDTINLL